MSLLPRLLPRLATLFALIAVFTGLFALAGWLGGSYWLLDLANHPQIQYAAVLAVCVVVLLCLKSFRLAAMAGVFLLLPVARLAPCLLPSMEKPVGTPLKFATFNVLSANTRYADAVTWIRQTDPDVIFLPEVDPGWSQGLKPLEQTHPYVIEHIVEGNFGFALYSKLPVIEQEIIPCGQLELPLLKVKLEGPTGTFILFGAHPVPPVTDFWESERAAFLNIMADQVKLEPGPVVVAGDLNASRWSHAMKPLFAAGLMDTSRGHGVGATWQRGTLAGIPIDHLLFRGSQDKPGLANCRSRWIGPDLGSDHRPVVAEIAW